MPNCRFTGGRKGLPLVKNTVIDPTARKSRTVNHAQNTIPLSREGVVENLLLHRHMSGYLLVGLNGHNEPVAAWRDREGIFPIRSRRIATDRFAATALRVAPKTIYMNDGEPLRTVTAAADGAVVVTPYTGSPIDLLAAIRVRRQRPDDIAAVTSYEDVRQLDPNITYDDYRMIYDNRANESSDRLTHR